MPLYKYESFNRQGKKIEGTIDAPSFQSAKNILQGQGLMPSKIEEISAIEQGFSFASLFEKKIDTKTKILFTKQLSVLLKAGIPLLQCFELLIEQFEGKFRRVLIDIKDGLKSGESLESQLKKYPKIFSNVYVQLVRAGEASGKLYIILNRLIGYLEKEEETKKRIKKAMSYPIFMITFSLLVVVGMIMFLVPTMMTLFKDMGMGDEALPGPTLFLKNLSEFILGNYVLLIILLVSAISMFLYWKSTSAGQYKLDELFLRFPVTAYFSKVKAVAQFCKTLGMLLEAGVNLSESLDIVTKIIDNQVLKIKLQKAKELIIKEGKISKYLKDTGIFPNIAIYMISTGEQSGNLDQMLLAVGNDYEVELAEVTDGIVAKISPMMTIVTGAIVAFIVLSVFLPMMELTNKLKL
ncbi:type II secretion system F family protein [Candidatus Babeliales bacterium]|nr:type II secretion system F family protein [Candidatus Babeliales bacterium]